VSFKTQNLRIIGVGQGREDVDRRARWNAGAWKNIDIIYVTYSLYSFLELDEPRKVSKSQNSSLTFNILFRFSLRILMCLLGNEYCNMTAVSRKSRKRGGYF
jgi:hypothetical protein